MHTGVQKVHVINVRPYMGGPKERILNSIFCWWAGLWIKDLLSMALPIRTRPRFLLSQSLPSGSFHKPLILFHQRADRLKTTITENYPMWSHGPQPCLIQWNYEPCRVGPPRTDGSWWRVLKKRGPLEKGMANHFSILALRTPWTVWKGKKIWQWKINSPGW